MKITVTVEDPTPVFQTQLLALLADNAAAVVSDSQWTIERASRYYLSLPSRAQRILREAAINDGYVSADDLRDEATDSLRGHSAALKQGLRRGVSNGWWPEGMLAPIRPQGPGFGKVVGYRMPDELVATFFSAITDVNTTQRTALADAIAAQGGTWDTDRAVAALDAAGHKANAKGARAILRRLADTGLIVKTDPSQATYHLATDQ